MGDLLPRVGEIIHCTCGCFELRPSERRHLAQEFSLACCCPSLTGMLLCGISPPHGPHASDADHLPMWLSSWERLPRLCHWGPQWQQGWTSVSGPYIHEATCWGPASGTVWSLPAPSSATRTWLGPQRFSAADAPGFSAWR